MGRSLARAAVFGCALAVVAPAVAVVCHPDLAGTKSVSLRGQVIAYRLAGRSVIVAIRSHSSCTTFTWRTRTNQLSRAASSCGAVIRAAKTVRRSRLVRLQTASSIDSPDRLVVRRADGTSVHSWALPVRASVPSLRVVGGLAAYRAVGGSGLYVTSVSDGRTTLVAPVARGDQPVLGAAGVVFHDDVMKKRPAGAPLLKFVPRVVLERELADMAKPMTTVGPIRAISVDGTRVAVVVGGGGCDWVRIWNVAWRSAYQVSEDRGPTCDSLGASGRISSIALGGARMQWVTWVKGRAMVVAADAIGCQEWVLERLADAGTGTGLAGIAGGGGTLALALTQAGRPSVVAPVGIPRDTYRVARGWMVGGVVTGLAAERNVLAYTTNEGIVVRRAHGGPITTIAAAGVTSLAMSGNMVAATRGSGRLDVFSARSGRLLSSTLLPAGAGHVDLQYGIATVTAGDTVYGIDVHTGRTVRLVVAPAPVQAQIGSIGIVYAYSLRGHGIARVIGMNAVEARLR